MDAPLHGHGKSPSEGSSLATGEEVLDRQRLLTAARAKRLSRLRPSPISSQVTHAKTITWCRPCLHWGVRLWPSPPAQSCTHRLWSCRSKWSLGSGRRWKRCSTRRVQVRLLARQRNSMAQISMESPAERAWSLEGELKRQREAGWSLLPEPEWFWLV